MDAFLSLEAAVLLFFQERVRVGFVSAVLAVLTGLADHGILCIVVCLVLIAVKKTRYQGITALCCLGLAFLVTNLILKPLIDRPRPYEVFTWLETVGYRSSDSSFPSGHANACFATAYGIWKSYKGRTWLVFVPAAVIAAARVYEGVHYPSDVIAGIIVGTLCAAAAYRLRVRYLRFPKTE